MYNLSELSDYDFERLLGDLLSVHWGADVASFPRGVDGGVDLRVLGPAGPPLSLMAGQELVVQCKHWPAAKMPSIRKDLRKEATKPVVDLASRYVLATSASLTRANKKEVVGIFGDRIQEADVLGLDDVTGLLRRHPEVERMHPKLWLTSAGVLQTLLHQAEHRRSAALAEELSYLRTRFVETSALTAALKAVEHHRVCILAGPPGVGKTTTAKMVMLRYMAQDWQAVVAVKEVRELEDQLDPAVNQILFFDDFLGQNSFDQKLSRGEDAELLRLLRMVGRAHNKILLLTTRDYVLQQARQRYEKLSDDLIDVTKVRVTLAEINRTQRARILYNQLYYSPLRAMAASVKDGPQLFSALTSHRNYNPRLLELALDAVSRDLKLDGKHSENPRREPVADLHLPTVLRDALDNPARLWDHVLRHQLNALQLQMLMTRVSLGSSPVAVGLLLHATKSLVSAHQRITGSDLNAALGVLEGDFFSTRMDHLGEIVAGPVNPGVSDAVSTLLHDDTEQLVEILKAAITFEQVQWSTSLLGMGRKSPHQNSVADNQQHISHVAVAAAQRCLMARTSDDLGPRSTDGWHPYLADRLNRLHRLMEIADVKASHELGQLITSAYLKAVGGPQRARQLVDVVLEVSKPRFEPWRSERTRLAAIAYQFLEDPQDMDDWETLRDLVDAYPPTAEYLDDLEEQFQAFADEFSADCEQMLDDDPDELDRDETIDELARLDELATRWNAITNVIELTDRIEELPDPPPPQPSPGQMMLPLELAPPGEDHSDKEKDEATLIFRYL